MDRLECMEAFVASVDHGSLSGAARARGRSIAAISRAIVELATPALRAALGGKARRR
jgi:DNA-binding transcriptional LysR family regulator